NWPEILQIYDALFEISGSPVVAINRALAVAGIDGAEAGLNMLNKLGDDARLGGDQPDLAARAELLGRTNPRGQAHRAYEIAIGLERDDAVRRFLQKRQSKLNG